MTSKTITLSVVLAVAVLSPIALCGQQPALSPLPTPTELQQQAAALRAQMQALQDRLTALEQKLSTVAAAAPAPAPESPQKPAPTASEPFSFADFTWLNGNGRVSTPPLDTPFFTPEIHIDTNYLYDFNHPQDDTLVGTTEGGRTQEVQVQQLGVGGDFHYENVRGRLMTQFGLDSTMTPRNDATPGRGQWDLANAYRYLSEAYGGYHFNAMHGVNVDAGIFMSYIGLFSYYNTDNWAYQPSYVSSNTPWYFNGLRVQTFPTNHLKVEFWLINGWQSYGRANGRPGLGTQILWRPNGAFSFVTNEYGVGADTLGVANRTRWHSDSSVQLKYYDAPDNFLDKAAFSITADAGCESGGGVTCFSSVGAGPGAAAPRVPLGAHASLGAQGPKPALSPRNAQHLPRQYFIGAMAYNRFWLHRDRYGLTLGGGWIDNPGRYLVLLPPINGATAFSGTPYFTENPGDPFRAWDASATFDYMPNPYVTFRWEYDHRAANIPYFAGRGGVTPPGGNTGAPGSTVAGWSPDLAKTENRLNLALLVAF